jgi:hypothetical protein
VASLAACAGGAAPRPGPARGDYRGILEARLAGVEPSGRFRLRANPVDCACPAFEVEVGGRWLRAAVVEGEREVLLALMEAFEEAPDAVYLLDGELGGELLPCGKAALYVEVEAVAWGGLEGDDGARAP